jgi:GT2 family glycosyltransferase
MTEKVIRSDRQKFQVTAVIVTYHSRNTIGATLDALFEAQEIELVKIVVVDNASKDGTADFIAAHYPSVHLVQSNDNLGFGRGCNLGFRYVDTPYVLFLNPDAILDLQALRILVSFMEQNPKVAVCGPAVKEASGALQPSGGLPTPWKIMLKPLLPGWASRGQRHIVPGDPPLETDWICGSIMLIRSRVFEALGGFDPRFFLYFEETDLCIRVMRSGWQIWTTGQAVAWHVNAASAMETQTPMMWGTISEHYFQSRFYYMRKYFGWTPAIIAELGELVCMCIRNIVDRARGRSYTSFGSRLRAPIFKFPPPIDEAQM